MTGAATAMNLPNPALVVRRNVVANLVGKAGTALLNVAFIPLWIQFMGVESYGLVGAFASLVVLLSILELGLGTTLSRELARLSVRADGARDSRDLVRTFELIFWTVGLVVGCGVSLLGPVVARYWLNVEQLSENTVSQAVVLMGLIVAVQWPMTLYAGGLQGVQRQVLLNVVTLTAAALRGLGAVLVLWLVEPTIQAFFIWQFVISALQTLLLAGCLWAVLPRAEGAAAFRNSLLLGSWRFAAGMTGITILATVLTQLDKVVVSRLVSLEMFGYYSFSVAVGMGLVGSLVMPIFAALFPRFTQLVSEGNREELVQLYHRMCQFVAVLVLPISICVALFARELLPWWLRDPVMVERTYLIVSVATVGTALNSLVVMPYAMQLAHGWTKLFFYQDLVAVAVLVPTMLIMVRHWGPTGAAVTWVLLNASYVLINIPLMHRRILKGEMSRWYLVDVGLPLVISLAVMGLARLWIPAGSTGYAATIAIGGAFLVALGGVASVLPLTREWLAERYGAFLRRVNR